MRASRIAVSTRPRDRWGARAAPRRLRRRQSRGPQRRARQRGGQVKKYVDDATLRRYRSVQHALDGAPRTAFDRRRAHLFVDGKLVASLGIPVKDRAQATPTHSVAPSRLGRCAGGPMIAIDGTAYSPDGNRLREQVIVPVAAGAVAGRSAWCGRCLPDHRRRRRRQRVVR